MVLVRLVVYAAASAPAFVLAHDSRTFELCEDFAIPHRKIGDVPPALDSAAAVREGGLDRAKVVPV
jgi:hypothetical protein